MSALLLASKRLIWVYEVLSKWVLQDPKVMMTFSKKWLVVLFKFCYRAMEKQNGGWDFCNDAEWASCVSEAATHPEPIN